MTFDEYVGEELTDELLNNLKLIWQVRIIQPGRLYTQDYRFDRINICLDGKIITSIHIG
jgi:hypothetical protein